MAIPKFSEDVEIISKLGDVPGTDDGLSTAQFKAKFDRAAVLFKEYINNVLTVAIDKVLSSGSVFGVNFKLPDANGNVTLTANDINIGSQTITEKIAEMDSTAAESVTTDKIANAAVTADKIAADAVTLRFPVTIPASGWTGEEAPFTNEVFVANMLPTYICEVGLKPTGNIDSVEAQREAFGYIYDNDSGENAVTFKALEKPEVDVPVLIVVERR